MSSFLELSKNIRSKGEVEQDMLVTQAQDSINEENHKYRQQQRISSFEQGLKDLFVRIDSLRLGKKEIAQARTRDELSQLLHDIIANKNPEEQSETLKQKMLLALKSLYRLEGLKPSVIGFNDFFHLIYAKETDPDLVPDYSAAKAREQRKRNAE